MSSFDSSAHQIDKAKAALQQLLPTRLISLLTYRLARLPTPWIKGLFNRLFVMLYDIDLKQAEKDDIKAYTSFNDLFTRALKPGARPVERSARAVISPCDGTISAVGQLNGDQIIQAKGITYSVAELMANLYCPQLADGVFITIYLSPGDYHRIHAPVSGRLIACRHIPGRLLSVAPSAVRAIPKLFARNERLVTVWQTHAGIFALIPIGALNVGSIETVWDDDSGSPELGAQSDAHNPLAHAEPPTKPQSNQRVSGKPELGHSPSCRYELCQGEELGRFNLGSTVILLFPQGKVDWRPELSNGSRVAMGQTIGELCDP